jgi:hypothetical protein
MVWQLKAFPIMMQRMALGTDERGGVLTNAMRAGRHWLASNSETFKHVAKPGDDAYTARDAIPAAMLLTIGPLGGALALSAKDVVQQRAEDDEWVRTRNAAKTPIGQFVGLPESDASDLYGWYWESAMMVGGLGFLAELMQDLVAQQDNGYFGVSRILSTVLGPWVSLGVDGYVTFQGLSEGARQAAGFSDGSGVGQERAAIRNVVNRIPGLGSNFAAREGIVNAIQPEAPKGNGGGGGGGVDRSAWNAGFDTQWGSDW